jgi:hypothetical protein
MPKAPRSIEGGVPWAAASALVAASAWGFLVLYATNHGFWARFNGLFWFPGWPPFGDFGVYQAGMRSWASGIDPLKVDLQSAGIIYNYPRIWLWGTAIGLQKVPQVAAGLTLAGLFIAAVWMLLRPRGPLMFAVLLGLVIAPPVHLLLERGNIDVIVFLLVACGLGVGSCFGQRLGAWIDAFAVMLAAILKLYPLAALAARVATERGYRRRVFVLGSAAAVLFLASRADELKLVSARTPRPVNAAYGAAVLPDRLLIRMHIDGGFDEQLGRRSIGAGGLAASIASLVAMAGAAVWGRRRLSGMRLSNPRDWKWESFCSGSAVYCGSFFLGNNWDYRLVFLIFCIPHLARASLGSLTGAGWARITFAFLGVTLLSPLTLFRWEFILVQGCNWSLGLLLAAGVGAQLELLPVSRNETTDLRYPSCKLS